MMPPACRPGHRCPVSEVVAERPDNFWTALARYRIACLLPEHLRTETLPCRTVLRRLTPVNRR
jgi:hypothetical protein